MTDSSITFERIKTLMVDGGFSPTPVNYEFWYRYVTRTDQEFAEEIDSLLGKEGKLTSRTVANVRRRFFGKTEEDLLEQLMDEAQSQIVRLSDYVGESGDTARTYKETLNGGNAALQMDMNIEMQRALLAKMAAATHAMIDKAAQLEAQLARSGQEISALRADLEKARSESRTDPLTGLANRKAFMAYLEAQSARAVADRKALSLVFLDIDHFKMFNDRWGHHLGDEVLRLVGQSMEHFCHGIGFPARWGGEEFVIALPAKDLESSGDIAEQFRDFIGSRMVRSKAGNQDVGRITLSLGVAQMRSADSLESLISRADQALYSAKRGGRNQVAFEAAEKGAEAA